MNLETHANAARETDHRVSNCLQFLTVMLRHESKRIDSAEAAREVLEKAAGRLAAMARVHRQLTTYAPDEAVDLAGFLRPFCADVAETLDIAVSVQAPAISVPASMACEIGIILNEFATNAAKHACCDRRAAGVQVMATHDNGQLRIVFSDDGDGLPEGFSLEDSAGLGVMIMISSAQKIGGTMRVVPGRGTCFEVAVALA